MDGPEKDEARAGATASGLSEQTTSDNRNSALNLTAGATPVLRSLALALTGAFRRLHVRISASAAPQPAAEPSAPDQATVAFYARRKALERAQVRLARTDPADGPREFFVEFRGKAVRARSLTAAKNEAWKLTHPLVDEQKVSE